MIAGFLPSINSIMRPTLVHVFFHSPLRFCIKANVQQLGFSRYFHSFHDFMACFFLQPPLLNPTTKKAGKISGTCRGVSCLSVPFPKTTLKTVPRHVRSQEIFKGSGAPFCLAMPWGFPPFCHKETFKGLP